MYLEDYSQNLKGNTSIFIKVLEDLSANRDKRPLGKEIPENLGRIASIDAFVKEYSNPERSNEFTISYFKIDEQGRAVIGYDNIGSLEHFNKPIGNGYELVYLVSSTLDVKFDKQTLDWEFKSGREENPEVVALFRVKK